MTRAPPHTPSARLMDTVSYKARLSVRIWTRSADQAASFWFCPHPEGGLILERTTRSGDKALAQLVAQASQRLPPGVRAYAGRALVDQHRRFLFCGEALGEAFLNDLVAWVHREVDHTPALSALEGAGAVDTPVDRLPTSDAAEPVQARYAAWGKLNRPSIAQLATRLASLRGGDRLWFVLSPADDPGVVPLVLVPLHEDPSLELVALQGRTLRERGPDATTSGLAVVTDAGWLELRSGRFPEHSLDRLARFVSHHLTPHPELARLNACRLAWIGEDGRYTRIEGETVSWPGQPKALFPDTVAHGLARLSALEAGEQLRFWLAGNAGTGMPALAVCETNDSATATTWLERQARRFPQAVEITAGSAGRLPSGTLLLMTEGGAESCRAALHGLVSRHKDLDGSAQLRSARIVQTRQGRPLHVLQVS